MFDLFRPFSFLTIRHPTRLPLWVNWLAPAILTILMTSALFKYAPSINIFSAQGLIERVLGFVQNLAGFYIAALAAVSSFNSPHLDKEMPKPTPTMWIRYNGVNQDIPATRRRFLTSMFAYLTAMSFLLTLTAIAALLLAPLIASAFPNAHLSIRFVGVIGFLFLLTQMTLVTFWGLFYLGERMLTPD